MNESKILVNLMKITKKNCTEESYKGYLLKVDAQYPEKLHESLPERMELGKIENLVTHLYDRN